MFWITRAHLCGTGARRVELLHRHANLLAHPNQHPVIKVGVKNYPSVSHTARVREIPNDSIRAEMGSVCFILLAGCEGAATHVTLY